MDESRRSRVLQFVQNALLFGDGVVLPSQIDRHLIAFADEEFGQNWIEIPEVVEILSTGLKAVATSFTSIQPPGWDLGSLMAYLFGFGPLHFHKVPFLLRNALRKGILKNNPRILDLGCGPGVSSLSTIYFFELVANASRIATGTAEPFRLRLQPLDAKDEALRLYQKLIQNYQPSVPEVEVEVASPIQATLAAEPDSLVNTFGNDRFDIIIASHVIGEMRKASLSARGRFLKELGMLLEPGGVILFAESAAGAIPSEMNQLKSRAVGEGMTLFSPCANAWEKPTGRQCYSCGNVSLERVRKPMIAEILGTVCEGYDFDLLAGRNSWAHGILRTDDIVHHGALEIGSGLFTKLSDLAATPAERANVYGAIAKMEIGRVDEEPFFKICDQTCGSDIAYLKFAPAVGVPSLENGDVLEMENVRVEAAKGGKNKLMLVVDGETIVRNLSREFRHLPAKHALTPEVLA